MRRRFYVNLVLSVLVLHLLTLVLVLSAYPQTNRLAATSGKRTDGRQQWSGDLTFHKKTALADGTDSLFYPDVDSVYVAGVSDTVWSDVYRSKGRVSIQFELTGTVTAAYIEIWTANSGDWQPQWLPEKYFKPAYWVVTGTGMSNNYVKTAKDSLTATAITLPIYLPMLDGELFRIVYITSAWNGANQKSWLHAAIQLREGDQ